MVSSARSRRCAAVLRTVEMPASIKIAGTAPSRRERQEDRDRGERPHPGSTPIRLPTNTPKSTTAGYAVRPRRRSPATARAAIARSSQPPAAGEPAAATRTRRRPRCTSRRRARTRCARYCPVAQRRDEDDRERPPAPGRPYFPSTTNSNTDKDARPRAPLGRAATAVSTPLRLRTAPIAIAIPKQREQHPECDRKNPGPMRVSEPKR